MLNRSFILGAIFGAAIFALGYSVLGDRKDSDGEKTQNQPIVSPPQSSARRSENVTEVVAESVEPIVKMGAQSEVLDTGSESIAVINEDLAYSRWPGDQESIAAAEPKDESWAYHTELAIQDFLATRPKSSYFDISYIECRTTICQIKAFGFDESTQPVWQQYMFEMRQQPWFDFNQQGNSFGWIDGKYIVVQNFEHRVILKKQ